MQTHDPSPFCEAKGGRGERSKTQGVHNATNTPVIPANATVIPAQAGIQRKTKHAALPSPSRSPKDRQQGRAKRSDGAGDARPAASPHPSMQERQGEGEQNPPLDVEAARASMTRMANIFADIAKHAEDSSLTRCPYKDARSRCTAKFACRNQHFTKNPLNPPICTAKDGDLNYRSAWEV